MLLPTKKFTVSYASVSRAGGRELNEDAVVTIRRDDCYCFVVADGLGGHLFGGEASRCVTEVFAKLFVHATNNRLFLKTAFEQAQAEILALQKTSRAKSQMRTTAVVLSIIRGKCAWGHVGDSRLYYYKRGKILRHTLDHSVPQMIASTRGLSEQEIASHSDRSRLLRVIGDIWSEPQYEISKEIRLRQGMAFLLCTDGVWEHIAGDMPIPPPDADSWMSVLLNVLENVEQISDDIDNYSAVTVTIR